MTADKAATKALQLQLAKSCCDYDAVDTPEHKKASKLAAAQMIMSTPVIKAKLAKVAVPAV